jgi:hypothetical protein
MSTGVASAAAAALLPRVTVDSPTVVLLVELATRRVVQANPLATQLAPGVALPAPVDAWSDAAGLRDLGGEELSETDHPLSLADLGGVRCAPRGDRLATRRLALRREREGMVGFRQLLAAEVA